MGKYNNKRNKLSSFFKSFGLLLRCLFASISYAALWVGIVYHSTTWGIVLIIIGALATLVAIFANIVVPISRLK